MASFDDTIGNFLACFGNAMNPWRIHEDDILFKDIGRQGNTEILYFVPQRRKVGVGLISHHGDQRLQALLHPGRIITFIEDGDLMAIGAGLHLGRETFENCLERIPLMVRCGFMKGQTQGEPFATLDKGQLGGAFFHIHGEVGPTEEGIDGRGLAHVEGAQENHPIFAIFDTLPLVGKGFLLEYFITPKVGILSNEIGQGIQGFKSPFLVFFHLLELHGETPSWVAINDVARGIWIHSSTSVGMAR